MKTLDKIKTTLLALCDPRCWIRNEGTSKPLSDFIEERLANGELPSIVSTYTMTLGWVSLWRGNWPYSYGSTYPNKIAHGLPSRRVAYMLRRAEDQAMYNKMLEVLRSDKTEEA